MQKYGLYLRPYFQNRCNTSTLVVGRRRTDYQAKYPCLEPGSFFIASWRKLLKTLLAGSEKGKWTQCGGMPFLELELSFYSKSHSPVAVSFFPNLKAASVIPYLFLFSYKTSKRPPMAQSRMLQVEKLKPSHSFLAIPWLTIISAVKELWQKILTRQPLPVYSIKSIFFITLFLLGRFICCARQEPEEREQAGVRSSPWRSCAPGPLLQHPTLWGWSNSQMIILKAIQQFCKHGEVFCMRPPICPQFPLHLGGWKQSRGAGNRLLEGKLNTKVCHCPAGMGELAGKLDIIDAWR